jgi:hypothetical protein
MQVWRDYIAGFDPRHWPVYQRERQVPHEADFVDETPTRGRSAAVYPTARPVTLTLVGRSGRSVEHVVQIRTGYVFAVQNHGSNLLRVVDVIERVCSQKY